MATQEVAAGPMAIVDKMYACFGTGDMETIRNEVYTALPLAVGDVATQVG